MSSSATETTRFEVEAFRAKPVARVTPEESTGVIGTRILFSGAGSTVDGSYEGLTLYWELTVKPDGSTAALVVSETSDKAVELEGDVTGTYVVALYVVADGVRSDTVECAAFFSPAVVPAVRRNHVDGTFMFNVLSDFWSLVNDREVFPIVWSGISQSVASDFLRAFQVDRAKSISSVQPLFQTRWMKYSPEMTLDPSTVDVIYGGMQSGDSGFTGSVSFVGSAVVISKREVIISGPTTIRAIGSTMTLYSGTSAGSYLINRLNAARTGYILSEGKPLIGPELKTSGTNLVASASALDEVYDLSKDFVALGVEPGDRVRILRGRNSGLHVVKQVLSSTRIELESSVTIAGSNMVYEVLKGVRASFQVPQTAFTDTVYIPKADADFSEFNTGALVGTGTVTSNFEVLLESRHVVDSVEGARIRITSGERTDRSYEIASINDSFTGVVVANAIEGTVYPEEISYSINLHLGIRDRMMVLDGVGHKIAAVEELTGLSPEDEGGRGDLWAVTLQGKTAPSGREGIKWRVCPTLRSHEIEDFEAYGVSAGDLLEFEVMRTDLEIAAKFSAQVLGAQRNEIAFDFGTEEIPLGRTDTGFHTGTIDDEDLLEISSRLAIPTVTLSESGEATLSSHALDIYSLLHSSEFKNDHRNLPLDPTTSIRVPEYFNILVRPTRIIRNSRVAIDPEGEMEHEVFSIPALFEYIKPEQVSEADEGYVQSFTDSTTRSISRAPVQMSENNDYALTQTELTGAALSTTSGSSRVLVDDTSLIFRGVRPGDELEITTGLSQGKFAITAVISETEMRISGRVADGKLPVASQTSLEYVIRRRGQGQFIELNRSFTAADPAPASLWAPMVLLDNSKYIEDNFGVLVGMTKARLDEFGTTQLTYRSAIAGLMYSWASGPTLRSSEIGSHIVLDLPVTEKPSEIVTIEPEFSATYGRVIVEELDNEGTGTGLLNVYRYRRSDLYSLSKFKGLGTNPLTGSTFAEGDFLPPFTPLTNSVIITDRLVRPNWWREYSDVPGATELQKYHTWQAEIDVRAVDSRDIPLAADFLSKIRPIYTKPSIVAVLSLLDTVQVEVDFDLEMDMYFKDDPAFSREATAAFDDYNGSGMVLRRADFGSRSTRTLFQGDDLVMTAGSGVVTSARGGFTGTLTTLPRINEKFPDEVEVLGKDLIKEGDKLFVLTGYNRSVFEVSSVDSATQLTVVQVSGETPRAMPIGSIVADTDVKFQIFRDDGPVICSGTSTAVEDFTSVEAVTYSRVVLVDTAASFKSDGAAAGDRLIVTSGTNKGVYLIEDVGVYDTASGAGTGLPELFEDQETKLTLATALPSTDTGTYRIERWALADNPILTSAASSVVGESFVTLTDALLYDIERDDRLYDTDNNDVYEIVGVVGDKVYIDRAIPGPNPIENIEIHKLVFEDSEEDSDTRLERLMGYDTVELDIYVPLTAVDASGSVFVSGNTATLSSASSAAVGDLLVLDPTWTDPDSDGYPNPVDGKSVDPATDSETTSLSHGVYIISGVSGADVTIESSFPSAETLTGGTFTRDADFYISGTTVTTTQENPDTIGVRPGDFFEFEYDGSLWEILILSIDAVNSTFELAEDPSVSPAAFFTGRIFRRETPAKGKVEV
jgi:hypothetical protein